MKVDLTLFGTSGHSRPHLHVPSVRRYTLTSSPDRRTVPLGLKKKKKRLTWRSMTAIFGSETVLKFHLFCSLQTSIQEEATLYNIFIHDFVILLMLLKQCHLCLFTGSYGLCIICNAVH